MRRFPPLEPYARGLLEHDGQSLYWETSGSPAGEPALFLHGGPGGGLGSGYRRNYDPERFRVIGLDQRGCGRSRPLADRGNLATNTMDHLVADLEALRVHLDVDAWWVCGVSFGTTLALTYATRHPERVRGLVLGAVGTGSSAEIRWMTETIGAVFPEAWDAYAQAVPRSSAQSLLDAYLAALTHDDPAVRVQAARAWCAWEAAHVSLAGHTGFDGLDDETAYRFALLVVHYWRASCFLAEGEIWQALPGITRLPCALVHGRRDVSSPLRTAWRLHRAWPGSHLVVVEDEGHGGPQTAEALTAAIHRVAGG